MVLGSGFYVGYPDISAINNGTYKILVFSIGAEWDSSPRGLKAP